jgi:transcriptional regulator with XRE-family HTH domain
MTANNIKSSRKRGVVLTPGGLKKLQAAISEEERKLRGGKRYTQVELSDRIGVSTSTLSRLWSLSYRTDPRTLRICFMAFNLRLNHEDYTLTDSNDNDNDCLDENFKEDEEFIDRDLYYRGDYTDFFPESQSFLQNQTMRVNTAPPQVVSRVVGVEKFSSEIALREPALNHNYQSQYTENLKYPGGPLPLDSILYIPRPPVEELAYQEIMQPGCVIRIQGCRAVGKTSLMLRVVNHAKMLDYETVTLNINQADIDILQKSKLFLQWLAASISRKLGIEFNPHQHWDEEIGSKLSCTLYVKECLLAHLEKPLLLVLDEFQQIFEYPELAREFLPLLRSWHEEAQQDKLWAKLRFVIVYSTEIYLPLDINQSPFNIGLPLKLSEFTDEQVIELAFRYGIDCRENDQGQQLIKLIGGHPALINVACYHLRCQQLKLKDILTTASTQKGIYRQHLQGLLNKLQQNTQLLEVFKTMIVPKHNIVLDPLIAYQLESMGLIKLQQQEWIISCELYREFFREYLVL